MKHWRSIYKTVYQLITLRPAVGHERKHVEIVIAQNPPNAEGAEYIQCYARISWVHIDTGEVSSQPAQALPPGSDPRVPQPTPGPLSFPITEAAMSVRSSVCQQYPVPAFVSKAVSVHQDVVGRGDAGMLGWPGLLVFAMMCHGMVVGQQPLPLQGFRADHITCEPRLANRAN